MKKKKTDFSITILLMGKQYFIFNVHYFHFASFFFCSCVAREMCELLRTSNLARENGLVFI